MNWSFVERHWLQFIGRRGISNQSETEAIEVEKAGPSKWQRIRSTSIKRNKTRTDKKNRDAGGATSAPAAVDVVVVAGAVLLVAASHRPRRRRRKSFPAPWKSKSGRKQKKQTTNRTTVEPFDRSPNPLNLLKRSRSCTSIEWLMSQNPSFSLWTNHFILL